VEDYAFILDYLPQGRGDDARFKREPVAYGIGTVEMKLFELTPKDGATITVGDRVYIGKEVPLRTQILHVKRRVSLSDLTHAAVSELPYCVEKIVQDRSDDFLQFFNKAQSITIKMHMLELLPGLGKKTMWAIVEERRKGDFKSFEDLEARVSSVHNARKLVAARIVQELQDPDVKYHVFVAK